MEAGTSSSRPRLTTDPRANLEPHQRQFGAHDLHVQVRSPTSGKMVWTPLTYELLVRYLGTYYLTNLPTYLTAPIKI